MCKGLKLIFGGLIILLLCITVDLVSIYIINKPIFAIKGNNDNHYYGLFYDTYNCLEYSSPQIKFKGSKFSCLVDFEILEQHAYTVSVDETFNCSGNKDIYIGPLNMKYRDDFCKYDLNMREYID